MGRLSYWIGPSYWNRGLATEAGREVIYFGFEKLQIEEIEAECYRRNPSSGAVLRKLGFHYHGSERKLEKLSNKHEDFERYSLRYHQYFK